MQTYILGDGTHPSVTWHDGAYRVTWQAWSAIHRAVVGEDELTTIPLAGAEAAYPKVHSHAGKLYYGWREGDVPYNGTLEQADAWRRDLGPIHGASPLVFGAQYVAYQTDGATAGWPIVLRHLDGDEEQDAGAGVGVGLSRIVGTDVRTWDDDRYAVPGLHDPCWAGELVVGATDRDGQPCAVVQHPDGRELELWKGQDSQNPQMASDGRDGYCVVAWSAGGNGVRATTFVLADLTFPESPEPPEPPIEPPIEPGVLPPGVTIQEYLPTSGTVPLLVRAVAAIDPAGGPVDTLTWQAREAGTSTWQAIVTNPGTDLDHTYQFDHAGRYEIGLRAEGPGGFDQTGQARVVEALASPLPPEPEPMPPPETGVVTSFLCHDGVHYLCADLGVSDADGPCRLVADRTGIGVYEQFTIVPQDGGGVALWCHANGKYLRAKGGGGAGLYADRDTVGLHEQFTLEHVGDEHYTLRTVDWWYACAEEGGGGAVNANRQEAGPWETFLSTTPLRPAAGPGASGEVYAGGLCQQGNDCYADATGPALPVLCHYGDGLSKYIRDPGHVQRNLDAMRAAGYGGVRTWGSLGGSYWSGREVGPAHQGESYWQHVVAFCDELKARGMVWFLSQGDCYPQSIGNDPRAFFRRLGQTVRPYAAQIGLFETANESRDTTPGWDAGTCAQMAGEFHLACPEVTIRLLSAYTGHEDVAVTNDYSRDPATAFTVHGYRGGHWWDKVRHVFSFVYEQKPQRRLGWQGEPAGPGQRVSVTENKHELTDGPLMAMAAMSLMTRQGWVYFCGPGVISDEGETFAQMPGFACVPSVAAMLPKDLMGWTGGLFHGGETWASQRMFKPEGETRCDHAVSAAGAVVCLIYGPPPLRYTHVRGTIDVTHDLAGAATLIIGHY